MTEPAIPPSIDDRFADRARELFYPALENELLGIVPIFAQALRDAYAEGVEAAATGVEESGKLCRSLAERLAGEGQHAMAEMQRIRAEQCEGLAPSIRSLKVQP